jgi:hypothetical protein
MSAMLPGLLMGGMGLLQNVEQGAQQAYAMQAQSQLNWQSLTFDTAMNQQAENMREMNTLRDVDMQQRKADDSITKKFIESIGQ